MKWLVLILMVATVFSSRLFDERNRDRKRQWEVEDRNYEMKKTHIASELEARKAVAESYAKANINTRREVR